MGNVLTTWKTHSHRNNCMKSLTNPFMGLVETTWKNPSIGIIVWIRSKTLPFELSKQPGRTECFLNNLQKTSMGIVCSTLKTHPQELSKQPWKLVYGNFLNVWHFREELISCMTRLQSIIFQLCPFLTKNFLYWLTFLVRSIS